MKNNKEFTGTIKGLLFDRYSLSEDNAGFNVGIELGELGYKRTDVIIFDQDGEYNFGGTTDKVIAFKMEDVASLTEDDVYTFMNKAFGFNEDNCECEDEDECECEADDSDGDAKLTGEVIINDKLYKYELKEMKE